MGFKTAFINKFLELGLFTILFWTEPKIQYKNTSAISWRQELVKLRPNKMSTLKTKQKKIQKGCVGGQLPV